MFLIGSFTALRQFLDLGTSTGFFTFLCQRPRGKDFIHKYFIWMFLQLTGVAVALAFFVPDSLVQWVWLDHDRGIVVLAFLAVFLQAQVWSVMGQLSESLRETLRYQVLNLVLGGVHLATVIVAARLGYLTMRFLFLLLMLEHAAAAAVCWWVLVARNPGLPDRDSTSWREVVMQFVHYCAPFSLYTVLCFVFTFWDNWLLQRFSGARSQAFYATANQFSAVSILATAAMLNIFWKEIAEAHHRGDTARLASLYRKTKRFLFAAGAIVSCAFIPWSDRISLMLLGPEYQEGVLALSIMFLFPVHQAIGQLDSAVLLATSNTRTQLFSGTTFMLLSMPVSYAVLAVWGMGSTGLALKMVGLNMAWTFVSSYLVCRKIGARMDWVYQPLVFGGCIAFGALGRVVWSPLVGPSQVWNVVGLFGAGISYLVLAGAFVFVFPHLVGVGRTDLILLWRSLWLRMRPVQ